jgi:hypothetical protein
MTFIRNDGRDRFTRQGRRSLATFLGLTATLGMLACDSLLKVTNPNNVNESSLGNPAAAKAEVNGVVAATTRMIGAIDGSYATVTDELDWNGSRDAYNQLDRGNVGDLGNEFVDATFLFVGEARWLAWRTVQRLEDFEKDGALADRNQLARAYLYAALAYNTVANTFDDIALSNGAEGAANLGPANMVQLYTTAQGYLDKGIALTATGRTSTERTDLASTKKLLTAFSARNKFDKAVWQKLNPSGRVPAAPLVNDAGAISDASAALALGFSGSGDRFIVTTDANLDDPATSIGPNVKARQELRIATGFARLLDPVTGAADVTAVGKISEFNASRTNTPIHVTSAREMNLILAEAALAQNNIPDFTTYINRVRAMDNKQAWTGTPSAQTILVHERRVQLAFGLRRLNDLYRFGLTADMWAATESAVTCRGMLFQITTTERQSNDKITGQPGCNQ